MAAFIAQHLDFSIWHNSGASDGFVMHRDARLWNSLFGQSMMLRTLASVVLLTCFNALAAGAQTIPRFSAELTAGNGTRPVNVGEVWYSTHARESYLRTGVAVRIGSPGRVRPVLTGDYSHAFRGDQISLCGLAPNGSCIQYFPNTDGVSGGVGVRALLHSRLLVGAGAGVARYSDVARYVEGEAAIGLTRHVQLLAHWRRLSWREPAGGRIWFQPLTVGVRVQ